MCFCQLQGQSGKVQGGDLAIGIQHLASSIKSKRCLTGIDTLRPVMMLQLALEDGKEGRKRA